MLYSAVVAPQLQQVPSGIRSRGRRFSVRITVRFFAGMRERAGSGAMVLDVRDGATVDEAVAEVARAGQGGEALPSRVMKAVNGEYVDGDAVLREGDELALIPPVSGGVAVPRARFRGCGRASLRGKRLSGGGRARGRAPGVLFLGVERTWRLT